jgi:hypothetical protein
MYRPHRIYQKELPYSQNMHVQWVLTPDNDPEERDIWNRLYGEKFPRPADARSIEHAA